MMKASSPDRGRKHRTEPVSTSTEPSRGRCRRTARTEYPRPVEATADSGYTSSPEADHLGRAAEITEGIAHRRRLSILARRLKPVYSDNADTAVQLASRPPLTR